MAYITRIFHGESISGSRIMATALLVLGMIAMQSGTVRAQWTTPDAQGNINSTNTGKVGIGTTSPSSYFTDGNGLAVGGPGARNQLTIFGAQTGSDAAFADLNFFNNGIRMNTILSYRIGGDNSSELAFFTTNAGSFGERVRIDKSGNIGIGTASPGVRFDVISNSASTTAFARVGNFTNFITPDYVAGYRMDAVLSNVSKAGFLALDRWFDSSGSLVLSTNAEGGLTFSANNDSTHLKVIPDGRIGVGKPNPSGQFHVVGNNGGVTLQKKANSAGALYFDLLDYSGAEAGYLGYGGGNWNLLVANLKDADMQFYNDGDYRMVIQKDTGNVGIGETTPTAKLHVAGAGKFTGNLSVDGNIAAKYQDVAEWVESSQTLAAGTVVVLDHTRSNQVIASSKAYDTRVAGVISLQPGITLGEHGAGKVLVATTGRVKIKVDASAGSIQIGDLLVTSDKEGIAKKSEPLSLGGVAIHRPGTLIGKALEPLAKGTGEILVLLSLQ